MGQYSIGADTLALIASTMTVSGNMAGNVSVISMLYTLSAVAGPLFAGAAMKATHADALMWFTAAAAVVMAWVLSMGIGAKTASSN